MNDIEAFSVNLEDLDHEPSFDEVESTWYHERENRHDKDTEK